MNYTDSDELEYVIDLNPTRTLELTLLEYLEKECPAIAAQVRAALSSS